MNKTNEALNAEKRFRTSVEEAQEYIENFDILETINNVGNDEVFTPVKVCQQMLDMLPEEVWTNPNYKWLNPCDKNGVFLREIALRLDSGLSEWESDNEKRRKYILQNMIYSIGLTKFTAQVSRRTVYYCSQANRKFDGKVDQDGNSINGYAIGNGEWFDSDQGNILNPITNHTFIKGKCVYCGTAEKEKDGKPGRYSDPKQLEHYAYEFMHVKDIEDHLQKRFFGGRKMKFDIIIGNPPYQLSDGGGTGDSARPIYNYFVDISRGLSPKFISFIIPSRWMKGGKGLEEFRNSMMEDKHITKMFDYENANAIFPGTHIDGGVSYFLWESGKESKCEYHHFTKDLEETISNRYLKEDNFDIVIRDSKQINIIKKVIENQNKMFSLIVSSRNPFGYNADFFNTNDVPATPKINQVKIYGVKGKKGGAKRIFGYVDRSSVTKSIESIDKYKLYFSKAYMTTSTVPPLVIIGLPQEISTETFLKIGDFESLNEAQNCLAYIKTKFFRALLFYARHSLNISQNSFSLIPLLEFSKSWTDKELYLKYDLSEEEIAYIENNIKDME